MPRIAALVEPIMRAAGKKLMTYYGQSIEKRYKSGAQLVTEADLAIEQYLMNELGNIFQAHFFTEETGSSGEKSVWEWVIDPIDGTVNFVSGNPYFGISVALTYENTPVFGAIICPYMHEYFYAIRDHGAYLNDRKISVSSCQTLSDAVIGAVLSAGQRSYNAIAPSVYRVRHMGAYALDCAYVAAGRYDGAYIASYGWYDIAAGVILVQEAGGIVTDRNNEPLSGKRVPCIVTNARIHQAFLPIVP